MDMHFKGICYICVCTLYVCVRYMSMYCMCMYCIIKQYKLPATEKAAGSIYPYQMCKRLRIRPRRTILYSS